MRGGRGVIEFSKKGIPHGIVHVVRQIMLAGHIYMHNTTAPEAAHRFNVKEVIKRVRKGTDFDTSASSIDWVFNVRTWAKIIDLVQETDTAAPRKRVTPKSLTVVVHNSRRLSPRTRRTFAPLRTGELALLCNDARISYDELAMLISSFTSWDIDYVKDSVKVTLYCMAQVHHPGGERRTYWATDSRYGYAGGTRRDNVEVDLGHGKVGAAEITTFIRMDRGHGRTSDAVVIRWMDKSTLSTHCDQHDRPMCDYPLSRNHCLWEWSKIGSVRPCLTTRGFMNRVREQNLWGHVQPQHRQESIQSEYRARYDIIEYSTILRHMNVHVDPSTGHMLQTLQIV